LKKIFFCFFLFLISFFIESKTISEWIKKPQIYSVTVFDKKDSEKFSITVNGLWNGYIGKVSSPFAFGRMLLSYYENKNYDSDQKFVEYLHKNSFIVPATILTTQGHETLQGNKLKELSCKSYNGEISDWDLTAESKFMCSNNDNWLEWMFLHGKKAIDSGADLIVLDEIQGGGFIPLYQWLGQFTGMKEPGFCEHCIEGFRNYLKTNFTSEELKEKFNILNIENEELKERINSTKALKYFERVAKGPLIKEYINFNEKNNYLLKKRLVQSLRSYAKLKGRNIAISANSYAIGGIQIGDYWVKGLIFSDFLDFYTFENHYSAVANQILSPYPRNKWIAWEKLAFQATGNTFVSMLDTGTIKELDKKTNIGKFSNYLYIRFMEAYINKGAFAIYYGKPFNNYKTWEKCAEAAKFIRTHNDLFMKDSKTLSDIAILFLYSENLRNRYFSYLGISQILSESNIGYDVIFGGGGKYLKDRVKSNELKKYPLIIIPNSKQIEDNQKDKIKDYVREGGKAIIFSGESFGLNGTGIKNYGKGVFIVLDSWFYENREWDIGSLYFFSYEDKYRKSLRDLFLKLTNSFQYTENVERKIIVTPYYNFDKNQIIIHVLNYDHNINTDSTKEKENIEIKIKPPLFQLEKQVI